MKKVFHSFLILLVLYTILYTIGLYSNWNIQTTSYIFFAASTLGGGQAIQWWVFVQLSGDRGKNEEYRTSILQNTRCSGQWWGNISSPYESDSKSILKNAYLQLYIICIVSVRDACSPFALYAGWTWQCATSQCGDCVQTLCSTPPTPSPWQGRGGRGSWATTPAPSSLTRIHSSGVGRTWRTVGVSPPGQLAFTILRECK